MLRKRFGYVPVYAPDLYNWLATTATIRRAGEWTSFPAARVLMEPLVDIVMGGRLWY